MYGLDIKNMNMIKLKIILFTIALLLSITRIVWKYIKLKQKPKVYDFIWPLLFLWLAIKNAEKL